MSSSKIMACTRTVIAFGLMIFTGMNLIAQDIEYRKSRAGLTIGPGLEGGASIILDIAEGSKVKPLFAYRGNVHATYPLTDNITAGLGLGYENRGTKIHEESNTDNYQNFRVGYFTLTPGFTFSALSLDLNLGFPLGATTSDPNGSTDVPDGTDLSVMIEPRIGVVIPVVDNDLGWLSIVLSAGYPLNELTEDALVRAVLTRGPLEDSDFHAPSAHLGLRFEFAIPGTQREGSYEPDK